MSALCDYEVERERRVAENRRRMEEMGIAKVNLPTQLSNRPPWVPWHPAFAVDIYRIPFSYGMRGQSAASLQELAVMVDREP